MNSSRLFAFAFVGLGLWCLVLGSSKAMEGLRARSWPTAPGRVVISRVEEMRTSQEIRIARLCLRLDYLYLVRDEAYEGHRVNVGWSCFGSENRVRELANRYNAGREISVYYDPANPHRSLLEPGLEWSVFFLWGLAAVTLSACWPLIRRRRSSG
jgi:hypothetical protein